MAVAPIAGATAPVSRAIRSRLSSIGSPGPIGRLLESAKSRASVSASTTRGLATVMSSAPPWAQKLTDPPSWTSPKPVSVSRVPPTSGKRKVPSGLRVAPSLTEIWPAPPM